VTIAPDGQTVVFSATTDGVARLYARRRQDSEARVLPGTEGASDPQFSPDGQWVLFAANAELRKVSLNGPVVLVCKTADSRGATWLDPATIVVSPGVDQGLFRVPAAGGGTPQPLTTPDGARGERGHRWPVALPGGSVVLFTVGTVASPDNYDSSEIDAVVVATGERRRVFQGASMVRYVRSGHLVFSRGASLFAVRFDVDRQTISGEPVPVIEGVGSDLTTGAAHFAVADDGTLVYVPGSTRLNARRLFWVAGAGTPQPLASISPAEYNDPKISPDGRLAAVVMGPSGSGDIWVYDVERSTFTRLTFDGTNGSPVWSADGYVYYASFGAGDLTTFFRRPADGSRDAEAIAWLPGQRAFIDSFDRERQSLVLEVYGSQLDVATLAVGSRGPARNVMETPVNEYHAVLSPDRRWLAYVSDARGRPEVYVREQSENGGRWQVSVGGGEDPRWSKSGRALYFRAENRLLVAAIEPGPSFRHAAPRVVVEGICSLCTDIHHMTYDVDPNPNTERFLMVLPAEPDAGDSASGLRVVLNWFTDLRRR
jgi:serine/threonine-protein kinase